MIQRLYPDHPDVCILARYHDGDARSGGRAQHVVCKHPGGTAYAGQLAASLGGLLVVHGQDQPGPAPPGSHPHARSPAA